MEECTYPGCHYRAENMITKAHCRATHNMEREDLFKKYGKPKSVSFNSFVLDRARNAADKHKKEMAIY